MPRAGTFEYPARDLDDCLGYLRTAREKLKSRTMRRESFAEAIGQSVKGGGFGKLVGAMTEYQLVETGKGSVTTTDLAEQIFYGDSGVQRKGRERSAKGVRLFGEILRRFGVQPSEEQLRVFLRERGGMDIASAKRAAEEVGKLLRKNSFYLFAGASPQTSANESSLGELVGRLEMADYGILNIRDEISMDLAISLLAQVKKNKEWTSSAKLEKPVNRKKP